MVWYQHARFEQKLIDFLSISSPLPHARLHEIIGFEDDTLCHEWVMQRYPAPPPRLPGPAPRSWGLVTSSLSLQRKKRYVRLNQDFMAFAITNFNITYKATVDGVISWTGDDSEPQADAQLDWLTRARKNYYPLPVSVGVRRDYDDFYGLVFALLHYHLRQTARRGETGDVWFGDCDYPWVNFTLAERYGTPTPLILSVSRISHGPGFDHTDGYAPGADLINGWNERLNNIKPNSLFSNRLQSDGNAQQMATLREKMDDMFGHLSISAPNILKQETLSQEDQETLFMVDSATQIMFDTLLQYRVVG